MPGQPIDALGKLIDPVGPIGIGAVVMVPMIVTALGATSNGIPLLTLVSQLVAPTGVNITVSTLYSTQVHIAK